jgi:hypothetical protein
LNPTIRRLTIWFLLFLLCALVVLSHLQETAGFDRFHEIACDGTGSQRRCEPTGRQLELTRKPGDPLARPVKLAAVRIETFSATNLLESHTDQISCAMPDAHNFVCQEVLGATATTGKDEAAPWRQVHGNLFNDADPTGLTHYLNGLQFWRNRLLFGDFER